MFKNEKNFEINKVCIAIELGRIYNNFRWKFNENDMVMCKQIGRTGSNKKLVKMNIDKTIIETYASLKEASEKNNLKKAYLSTCALKNKLYNGFYWKYIT